MRKIQNELLLQKDALMFLLQCEHLLTPSNSTLAHVFLQPVKARFIALTVAFFRTDVPSSQYRDDPSDGRASAIGCFSFAFSPFLPPFPAHSCTCRLFQGNIKISVSACLQPLSLDQGSFLEW
jgi:hypothetical protein